MLKSGVMKHMENIVPNDKTPKKVQPRYNSKEGASTIGSPFFN